MPVCHIAASLAAALVFVCCMCVAIGSALFFPDMLVSHCVNKLCEEGKLSETLVRATVLRRCVQQE